MSQPREREVRCQGLCNRMTSSASGLCDKCSPHGGICDQCMEPAERRFAVRVPLAYLEYEELRFCQTCRDEALGPEDEGTFVGPYVIGGAA